MPRPIAESLARFETALAEPRPTYDELIETFCELVVPSDVTADELTRLYSICYRLFGIAGDRPAIDLSHLPDWQAGHLSFVALDVIERTLVDREASTRKWIADSRAGFIERGQPIPEELNDDGLPPRLEIPFDLPAATEGIAPLLRHYEKALVDAPACHFKLCWEVARDGYPVFREVVAQWSKGLDARGLGIPGTAAAVATARVLAERADDPEPMSWTECYRDVFPLLENRHPMIAAGAAVWLGALCNEGLLADPEAPSLASLLGRLAVWKQNRVEIAGGFVRGFDADLDGLSVLKSDESLEAEGFDLDAWVLACLAADKDPPYLPNTQALWFYVHEHYASNPAFVARLIDADRAWIAMMCATEIDGRVTGMRPVLERLIRDPDPDIAGHARRQLERFY
ncbi:MAG: hypothetical protein KDJ88_20840 [Bauldia sp.]|nr:hypothetical protein [Bauldia sp.]